jgi:triacylglycerol lipase
MAEPARAAIAASVPVLVVHGLWDTPLRIAPLADGLRARGLATVHAMELSPSGGQAPIRELARQVAREIDALGARSGSAVVDIVAFSMGALTTRVCLQRERASLVTRVRRFVSISGPHGGALNAFGLPAKQFPGVADMRPGSALLADLARDEAPLADVEVHCVYTPFDLMVTPAKSAVLAGARSVTSFPVAMHRFMVSDRRVLDHVAALLHAT